MSERADSSDRQTRLQDIRFLAAVITGGFVGVSASVAFFIAGSEIALLAAGIPLLTFVVASRAYYGRPDTASVEATEGDR